LWSSRLPAASHSCAATAPTTLVPSNRCVSVCVCVCVCVCVYVCVCVCVSRVCASVCNLTSQAVIGVALLSGFGSANAAKPADGTAGPVAVQAPVAQLAPAAPKKLTAEEQREKVNVCVAEVASGYAIVSCGPRVADAAPQLRVKMEIVEQNIKERERRGESFARFREMAAFAQREAAEKQCVR
jgi:hypothetical protein